MEYSANKLIPSFTKEIEGVSYIITKWHDEKYFYKKIVIEDPQLKKPLIYTEKVAKFSLRDFTAMFAKQGLVIKEVFGDYHFGTYNNLTSPRLIVVAEKSANQ